MLNFEFFAAAGSATSDGVLIPIADLTGLKATELAPSESLNAKESRTVTSLLNTIHAALSPASFAALGFTITRGVPAGAGDNLINQTFTLTWQKLVRLDTAQVAQIPVPTTGTHTGVGQFSILDVFANASKVESGDSTSAGVLIPTAELASFANLSHATLTVAATADNRDWFAALADWLAADASRRSTSEASAIINTSMGGVNSVGIPAAFTATNDPTSGLLAADLGKRGLISRSTSLTVQSVLNQDAQTFDVHVVTA